MQAASARTMRTRMSRVVIGLLLLLAPVAHAEPATPATPASGVHQQARHKLGRDLMMSGGLLLGSAWTASFGTSFTISLYCQGGGLCADSRWLWGWLPVAGPWVELGYDHGERSTIALFAVPAAVQ